VDRPLDRSIFAHPRYARPLMVLYVGFAKACATTVVMLDRALADYGPEACRHPARTASGHRRRGAALQAAAVGMPEIRVSWT
jgi:hypothetical protein